MSDEANVPKAAVEAVARFIAEAWHKREATVDDWDREQARKALAAAAPHMAGSGEAKRIVAALRSYSDDVDRVRAIGGEVGRISHRLADYIEREFARPDAERAPQEDEGAMRNRLNALADKHGVPRPNRYTPSAMASQPDTERAPQPEPRQDTRQWTIQGDPPKVSDGPPIQSGWAVRVVPVPEPRQDELEAVARAIRESLWATWGANRQTTDWPTGGDLRVAARAALDAARRPPSEQNADGG